MLSNLVKNAGNDFVKAEQGILIIDEIGKKTTKGRGGSDGRDISGEGVIDSLLPILSGAPINITVQQKPFQFETKRLKIFIMDACSGIEKIREKRIGEKSFGFKVGTKKEEQLSPEKSIYTKDDLIDYGFIPEFVGRVTKIHVTNSMQPETLVRVQRESKESVFRTYEKGLSKMNIKLVTYENFFKEVAYSTLDYGTGARELTNITNYVFENIMYQIYNSTTPISQVRLKEGITKDNSNFELY